MEMLAAGVYDLGLTAAEFSSLTPRHIDVLYRRHLQVEQRRMLLTLWYANVHRNTELKPDPFVMADFVPIAPEPAEKAIEAFAETQVAKFEQFNMKATEHRVKSPIRKWTPNG